MFDVNLSSNFLFWFLFSFSLSFIFSFFLLYGVRFANCNHLINYFSFCFLTKQKNQLWLTEAKMLQVKQHFYFVLFELLYWHMVSALKNCLTNINAIWLFNRRLNVLNKDNNDICSTIQPIKLNWKIKVKYFFFFHFNFFVLKKWRKKKNMRKT